MPVFSTFNWSTFLGEGQYFSSEKIEMVADTNSDVGPFVPDPDSSHYIVLEYNTAQQVSKSKSYSPQGERIDTYIYDQKGRWIKTYWYTSSYAGKEVGICGTTQVSYDSEGNRIKVEEQESRGFHPWLTQKWKDGNIIQEECIHSIDDYWIKRQHTPKQENKLFAFEELMEKVLFSFNPRFTTGNRHLITSYVSKWSGSETEKSVTATYQFNPQGYPIEVIENVTFPDGAIFNNKRVLEYECD